MSSQSKIEANRANAQKSTGPRTAEGKAKSSRNSTVHAFTSESPLLPDEDPADLQALCDAYFADLRPDGQAEEDLVERIAVAQYRLRRVPLLEAGYFDLRLRMRPLPECHNQDGKAKLMSWAYQTDCGAHNTLDKLGRYEGRLQREITRLNDNLQPDAAVTARLEGLNLGTGHGGRAEGGQRIGSVGGHSRGLRGRYEEQQRLFRNLVFVLLAAGGDSLVGAAFHFGRFFFCCWRPVRPSISLRSWA
jgi:hypothetical protein